MQVFKALSSPARLKIIARLSQGENSCGSIAEFSGLDISTISRHLAELERAGLISMQRHGKTVKCCVRNRALVQRLMELAEKIEKKGGK
ncbi:MAG: metalloregulator ArsR/SmtB family transcription factor [archaeon]